jgi:hypothetical protein
MTLVPPSPEGLTSPYELRSLLGRLNETLMNAWTEQNEELFCEALSSLAVVTSTTIDQLERERETRRQDAQRYAWKLGLEL